MNENDLKLLDAVRTAIMAKYDYSRPWFNDGVSAALDAVVAVELAGRPEPQEIEKMLRLRKKLDPDAPDLIVIDAAYGPPERIWTIGGSHGSFFEHKGNFATVEYIRADVVERLLAREARREASRKE